MAINGGTNSSGAIFSFDPNTNAEAVVYNFGDALNDGQFPNASLIYDAGNQLYYGMAQGGGTHQLGTIFSFNAANNAEATLWSLGAGFDGAQPEGSMLLYTGPTAGINTVGNNSNIALSPNPGNGNFTLQSQNTVGATYIIYNINGEVIANGIVETDHQNIALPGVAAGMYVLMLHGKDGAVPVRFAVTPSAN